MTVTAIYKDANTLTLTVTAEFAASPERIWRLWEDPRQLERWWGPPTYPATFDSYDFRAGGHASYHMTGPSGDQPRGTWAIVELDPPRRLLVRNALADSQGKPDPEFPITDMEVWIEPVDQQRTSMKLQSTFPSVDAMEQMARMGMQEGLREAVGQIDAILAEDAVSVR
jgi:uncharacterized protein YndB with AHSA1/START domain